MFKYFAVATVLASMTAGSVAGQYAWSTPHTPKSLKATVVALNAHRGDVSCVESKTSRVMCTVVFGGSFYVVAALPTRDGNADALCRSEFLTENMTPQYVGRDVTTCISFERRLR